MAKEDNAPYILSGTDLFKNTKARDIIPLTLSTDIGLGGGIPLGCSVLFGGKPKCGKTSTTLQIAANAQKLFNCKVFYANIEGRLDNKVLSQIQGLDLERFDVITGPPIYDKVDKDKIVGHKKMGAQAWWSAIGLKITENPRSIIIVDSVSALCDESELAAGMGYFGRGRQQAIESQFVRQYGDLIVQNQVTVFFLCQVIANTSGYGEALTMNVGNKIRHLADAILFIKNVEKWKVNADSGRIMGHDINIRVEASPLGMPYIDTNLPLRFGYGIDIPLDIARNAVTWGFIKAAGAWYTLPFKKEEGTKIFEVPDDEKEIKSFVRCQGEENLRQWVLDNPQHQEVLYKAVKEKIFI